MNDICDHFLANAALARNQDVCIRWRHRADQFLHLLHGFAFENGRQSCLRQLESLLQLLGFRAQLLRFL